MNEWIESVVVVVLEEAPLNEPTKLFALQSCAIHWNFLRWWSCWSYCCWLLCCSWNDKVRCELEFNYDILPATYIPEIIWELHMSMIRRRTRMTKKKKKNIKYELVREELHFNICQLFLLRWISLNRFVCLAPINRSSRTGTAHHLHLRMMQRKMQHSTHFEAVDWTLLERRFSQNNIFSKPCKLTDWGTFERIERRIL